ncbi:DLW-39 family protein [Pseudonocardia acaciae]|nr:DLW-39 family protein [Pseudonocardia acaciae]
MKKFLVFAAILGVAAFVFSKVRSRSDEDPWQHATTNN